MMIGTSLSFLGQAKIFQGVARDLREGALHLGFMAAGEPISEGRLREELVRKLGTESSNTGRSSVMRIQMQENGTGLQGNLMTMRILGKTYNSEYLEGSGLPRS